MVPFTIVPVSSNNLSAKVDLPWSMCAIMLKFLMFFNGTRGSGRSEKAAFGVTITIISLVISLLDTSISDSSSLVFLDLKKK